MPGDPAQIILFGSNSTPGQIADLRQRLGLNDPLWVQYLDFLGRLLHGDMGTSYLTQNSVAYELFSRLPSTLILTAAAMMVAIVIGVPLGMVAGLRPNSLLDGIARVLSFLGVAVPYFALVCEPKLLIADEPTTALEVSIQAQILELIDELKTRLGMGVLLITHDLGVIAGHADRVAVMYAGRVVEEAATPALFVDPRHCYTEALFESMPTLDLDARRELATIPGLPPKLVDLPPMCRFARRCRFATEECTAQDPEPSPSAPGTGTPAIATGRRPVRPCSNWRACTRSSTCADPSRGRRAARCTRSPGETLGVVGDPAAGRPRSAGCSSGWSIRPAAPSASRAATWPPCTAGSSAAGGGTCR
jgi:oligopeptide/dipeptide ABC transporter ATP-binding protein